MKQTINFESAFEFVPDGWKRYEDIKHACGMLVMDVESGPCYITDDENDGDSVTALGKTVYVGDHTMEGNLSDFFMSYFAKSVRNEVRAIVDLLPRYYLPDCDSWQFVEPEYSFEECPDCDGTGECDSECEDGEDTSHCEFCNGTGQVEHEPESYYELSEMEWFEFFFSKRTVRDIMG